MNPRILVTIATLSLLPALCTADDVGFLVHVINKSPYAVALQSTDRGGKLVKKDGNQYGGEGQPSIQMQKFNLADVSSFNFQIPWAGWDGQARIYIDVLRNFNDQNTLVNRYELMERYGTIELWKNNPRTYDESGLKTVASTRRNGPTQYSLIVDSQGNISFATSINFVFDNNLGTDIKVGSPNCSLETDLEKQYTTITKDAKQAAVSMLMQENCKIVVIQGDAQSTACFGFATVNTEGKIKSTSDQKPQYYRQIDCTDPECTPDPDTGISPCDNLGIKWIEDPAKKIHIIPDGHDYDAFYSIVKLKR